MIYISDFEKCFRELVALGLFLGAVEQCFRELVALGSLLGAVVGSSWTPKREDETPGEPKNAITNVFCDAGGPRLRQKREARRYAESSWRPTRESQRYAEAFWRLLGGPRVPSWFQSRVYELNLVV